MKIRWHIYKHNEKQLSGRTPHPIQCSANWVIAKTDKGTYNLYKKTEVWTNEYSFDQHRIHFIGNFITSKRAKDYAQMEGHKQ